EVKIVDEFTGRILEGRRWSEGIHQAVEAKEGVNIKEENQTLATITLQNYFRMYEKLSGMTGTAQTEAAELMNTYNLQVVPIPTNREMVRIDQADQIYKTEAAKFDAVVRDIEEKHAKGQPVLVGTVSVEKSEQLSKKLQKRGIRHEVLNAKQHTREAMVVTQAGRLGAITVATNMAGRGVDILLGGNPEGLARQDVLKEGFDPMTLLDEFALPAPLDSMPPDFLTARDKAQKRYREQLAKHAESCKIEGDKIRHLGGLYVLGTERHESRRIDNQLRGRAGRQGDPGESRFYLSLDDELMRLFATGALSWVMGRALPDDEAIEAKMVTKAIERAQSTVEQRNGEIRKNVLKYDEVMNEQRKIIYLRRDQILQGLDLKSAAMEYLAEAVDSLIDSHCVSEADDEWDIDGLVLELRTFWPSEISAAKVAQCDSTNEIYDLVMADASAFYDKRETEMTAPVMREVERQVMLKIIDQRWREHLEEMDYLQEGINLRAIGQKDPLIEWQREGFEMFGALMKGIAQDFVKYVMHVQVINNSAPASKLSNIQQTSDENVGQAPGAKAASSSGVFGQPDWSKTPRNAPCPCGSGKKYKMCHGRVS
ncbi:MAG: SEC-C metal-binding domain-containing protein, partial [Acidimicrobiaceae bacterium]